MSSSLFAGTLTVGEETFAVTGRLSRNGMKILGFLTFDDNEDREVPVNFIISGSSFKTYSTFWFTDPDNRSISILPISTVDSSVNTAFTQIDITDTDITIDGVADTLSLDLDIVELESSIVSITSVDEEVTQGTLRSLTSVRINEVGNTLDHFGGLLSTRRLKDETNLSYANRIRRATREPHGSDYYGLMYSINKDLGLEPSESISVKIKSSPAGLKKDLRFLINHNEAIIYTLWIPLEEQTLGFDPVVEQRISLDGLSIGKMVDWINQSANYEAKLLSQSARDSKFVMEYDSLEVIEEELLPQEIVKLSKDNVIPGSFLTIPTEYTNREMNVAQSLTERGQFKINYSDGIVYHHTAPKNKYRVTYTINNKEFVLKSSPIRIVDITSEGGQDLLFNQIEREFYTNEIDRYVNGLPKNEGYHVMREALTAGKFNQFWGE